MRKMLVTGGTAFVSRFVAEYFVKNGDEVYVLNRNNHIQSEGVKLIEADRHDIGDRLKKYDFDAVLDITATNRNDIETLVNALGNFEQYIFISSAAVYPEKLAQPFSEEQECGKNSVWGDYGLNKLKAEKYLLKNVADAYVLRPCYIYGPMQNMYREDFVFDCALQDRAFYVPKSGSMPLQFVHVEDLCRFIDIIIKEKPKDHVFNVGNEEIVDVNEWVQLCYEVSGRKARIINVNSDDNQRKYFCFPDYGFTLDVSRQKALMPDTKSLETGLIETFEWYNKNKKMIRYSQYLEYIDSHFIHCYDTKVCNVG